MKHVKSALLGVALPGVAAHGAQAQNEQFIPMTGYWVGPYAAGGSGIYGGFIDYLNMINARDGGINGVKLTWEKCETEYNNARGVECYERLKNKGPTGATVIHPLSTGITYSLIEKATADKIPMISIGYGRTDAADGRVFPYVFPLITNYWSQNTAKIKFIGHEGRRDGQAEGQEDREHLSRLGLRQGDDPGPRRAGQEVRLRGHAHRGAAPGQRAGGAVAADPPDQARLGDPARLGRDEPDGAQGRGQGRLPARPHHRRLVVRRGRGHDSGRRRGKGYIAAGFNVAGANFPVIQEIKKNVYAKGKGEMEDKTRFGSIYYNRGVVHGIITVEAIRTAQAKFGKKPITGEQIRWGIENLNITEARLKELGAVGFMQPLKVSCVDHEGGGAVKFQQWDGTKWNVITDWIQPDEQLVREMIEESAAAYAKEKSITPRDCSKEG